MREDGREEFAIVPFDASCEERAAFAHNLRMQGVPWREVWKIAEYQSDVVAKMQVKAWLQKAVLEMEQETRAEHLKMEIDRLDALQASAWRDALDGDKKAMDSVLRIIALRSRLLGLDNITTEVDARTQTVVITSDDYVQKLQQIAGASDEY